VWVPCSKPVPAKLTLKAPAKPGQGQSPQDVVYVLDRSGSMVGHWLWARDDVLEAVGALPAGQRFALVIFGTNEPLSVYPAAGLASSGGKGRADKLLLQANPAGDTDIVAALSRAFDVMAAAKPGRAQVIRLYTDGLFPAGQAVENLLEQRNAEGRVRIDTFLYGMPLPRAVGILQQIAHTSGGKFTYVTRRK